MISALIANNKKKTITCLTKNVELLVQEGENLFLALSQLHIVAEKNVFLSGTSIADLILLVFDKVCDCGVVAFAESVLTLFY